MLASSVEGRRGLKSPVVLKPWVNSMATYGNGNCKDCKIDNDVLGSRAFQYEASILSARRM